MTFVQYTVRVRLVQAEGALVRMLGTAERRGFTIHTCWVRQAAEAGVFDVELCVRSERPIAMLLTQLQRLIDVQQVELFA